MATYNAVEHAKTEITVPMKMRDAHSSGGRMRVLHDTYTQSGTGAVSSVINFGRLPGQCRIWEANISTNATIHASGTLALACGGVAILAATAFTSSVRCLALEHGQTAGTASAAPIVMTDGGVVTLTGNGSLAQIAGTIITVTIKYTID